MTNIAATDAVERLGKGSIYTAPGTAGISPGYLRLCAPQERGNLARAKWFRQWIFLG
jgi:hypothetical protein